MDGREKECEEVGCVRIEDENYPCLLKEIPDPPKHLYYKGNFCEEIFENCVAVVGSRKMSLYGKKVVEHLFSTANKSMTIVSGFMSGVDAEAHSQALHFGMKTIAVMPCGINYVHPEDQVGLYEKIIKQGGLILSEFESDFKPKLWTYPKRNRIVAGLSKVTVVVEASANSGSLITARLANSYGRKVFVVPGSIFSDLSNGKIQINNEFAKTIGSGFQINEFLGLRCTTKSGNTDFDDQENPILILLKNEPMTINELSEVLSTDISELSMELTLLSLDGLVTEQGGKFYAC